MLSIFTSLIDASFGVRCFLPSLAIVIGSIFLDDLFTGADNLSALFYGAPSRVEKLAGSVFIGLVAWVVGVLISAIQREIIRFLEGYGKYNPFLILSYFTQAQAREFRGLQNQRDNLNKQLDILEAAGKPIECRRKEIDEIYAVLKEVSLKLTSRFPNEESDLLPTSFGNAMRAFERYPNKLYGLDGVTGYTRLQAVIPNEYQAIIDEQRMYLDFWVNTLLAAALLLFELLLFAATRRFNSLAALGLTSLLLLLCISSYQRATSSAIAFGAYIRSAFDLYIDRLGEQLGLPKVEDPKDQRKIWAEATRAYLYGIEDALENAKYGYTKKKRFLRNDLPSATR